MLNTVSNFVQRILPTKHKTTPSGWTSFNAVCCGHNGESADLRSRGGLTTNPDGSVSYHCFNCGYKASYQPGRHLTFKFRKLLRWLGADESDVKRLVIEAIRIKDLVAPEEIKEPEEKIEFRERSLPDEIISYSELRTFLALTDDNYVISQNIINKINYVLDRRIDAQKYEFYITDSVAHSLHQRVIIPCTWQGRTIGYTARAVNDGVKPKYYSNYEPNFVFNIDQQGKDWKFVIVCEGPFDAMSVDGVAVLGNECSEQQAEIIDGLTREVIVVADRDKAGEKLINNALEYGWSVSFPVWLETCKDINEAVIKYGKLFVIKSILNNKQTNKLKIELMKKKLYA
jgi:DNA primase